MNTIDQNSLLSSLKQMAESAGGRDVLSANSDTNSPDFQTLMKNMIDSVNQADQASSKLKKSYELGEDGVSLTQVMIASQKSEISFQALLQVRNKLLSAYQEVMRIQI